MNHGLSQSQLAEIQRCIAKSLTPGQTAQVFLFGSRAASNHRAYSDVDLLLRADGLTQRQIQNMRDALEESDLPYTVDLVWEPELLAAYRPAVMAQIKPLLQLP